MVEAACGRVLPAEASGRTVDQVALDLLAGSVTHDEWCRREVEKGQLSARQDELPRHADVKNGSALSRLMHVRWTALAAEDLEHILTTSHKTVPLPSNR